MPGYAQPVAEHAEVDACEGAALIRDHALRWTEVADPGGEHCARERVDVNAIHWTSLLVAEAAVNDQQVVDAKQHKAVELDFLVEVCDQRGFVKWLVEWLAPLSTETTQANEVADVFVTLWWLTCCCQHGPELGC